VPSCSSLPRADALYPGYPAGAYTVRRAPDLAFIGASGTQYPLKIKTSDHVRQSPVAILIGDPRIIRLETGGEDDCPDIDLNLFRRLGKIDGAVSTHPLASAAFLLLEVKATIIDVGDERDGLGVVDVDRPVLRYLLVVDVRIGDRTILHARGTASALVLTDVARLFKQVDREVPRLTLDAEDLRIGENLDVFLPADLDQFR
jgi:hypothetical protein